MPGPDYRFRWNNYAHPNLVAAFDMYTRTAGGLMKNLAYTGATYDATIFGTYTQAGTLLRAKSTPCMNFGGVNEYLSLANPVSTLADMTIAFWINEDALEGVIWSRAAAAGNWLSIDIIARLHPCTPVAGEFPSFSAYPVARTYFIAWNLTGGVSKLYVNGAPVLYRAVTGAMENDANCYIGQFPGGILRLDGRLDNMMFYNICLTPAQIWSLWRYANVR